MVFPRLVLDERRIKKDGTYPLAVRVSHNRRTATFPVGISVKKEYWDEQNATLKKTHPHFKRLHADIYQLYHKVQKTSENLFDEQRFTLKALKEKLSIQPVIEIERSKSMTFNEYAKKLVNILYATNKIGNAIIYQTAVNRLLKFADYTELTFEQIDYRFLEDFKNTLIADGAKPNTVSNYFRTLRAIYNKAIKEKHVSKDCYYFNDIDFKPERTAKRAITKEELIKFMSFTAIYGSREWHSKNFFFLSFNLIGASFTDLAYFTHDNIINGRIEYKRRKTGKKYSIKLTKEALELISWYKSPDRKYLLPILPNDITEGGLAAKKLILQWIKTTNKYLKRIAKKNDIPVITTYVARHTWATLAKRMGYSNELIAEALGHEYGNRTTAIYLDCFEQDLVDNLNITLQGLLN